jgi:uncharacterized protein
MSVAAPAVQSQPQLATAQRGQNGRLREPNLSESDRNIALLIHLSPFSYIIAGPLALCFPLILWIVRKDESAFNDDHGREVVNFGISFIIWHFVLAITFIGVILIPVLWVVGVVNLIRGAVAAGRGEYFRYPVTIRFL